MRICSLHFEANCFKGKRLDWKTVAATLDAINLDGPAPAEHNYSVAPAASNFDAVNTTMETEEHNNAPPSASTSIATQTSTSLNDISCDVQTVISENSILKQTNNSLVRSELTKN